MNEKLDGYEYKGYIGNDGSSDYNIELLATGELLNHICAETILAMRDDIFRIIDNKREIFGGFNQETEKLGLTGLSDEVFFKNKITGAIISFTYTAVENIISSDEDLTLLTKSPNQTSNITVPIESPLPLNSLKKEDRDIFNNDEAIVVQFRPDIQTKFPHISE